MSVIIRILMREFSETLTNMNWDQILLMEETYPNISMNNLHQDYLLDEFAPFKKLSTIEYKHRFG